jgi:heme/copper-type cytochrome/quinol oxidase subunit 2
MAFGSRRRFLTGVVTALFGVFMRSRAAAAATPATQDPAEKHFEISARKYAFSPARLEVRQDDLVRVTLTTQDIPHSFTIDTYRISKRVGSGQSVVFEFRADQPGRFPIYCNLTVDPGCREMRGELVVSPRS